MSPVVSTWVFCRFLQDGGKNHIQQAIFFQQNRLILGPRNHYRRHRVLNEQYSIQFLLSSNSFLDDLISGFILQHFPTPIESFWKLAPWLVWWSFYYLWPMPLYLHLLLNHYTLVLADSHKHKCGTRINTSAQVGQTKWCARKDKEPH